MMTDNEFISALSERGIKAELIDGVVVNYHAPKGTLLVIKTTT